VYTRYINPHATESQILTMGHAMVAFFGLCMALAGVIFYFIGVSMGWLYTFMGVILGSAVFPIALAVTWSKANKWACIGGSIVGFAAGIIAWLVTTATLNDNVINVVTSGGDYEMLAGNVASIGVGGIVATVASYIWPENYDFEGTRAINAPSARPQDPDVDFDDVKKEHAITHVETVVDDELDPVALQKAFKFAAISSIALFLLMIILIPLPLFFSSVIYGEAGFTTWVVIGIIWTFWSAFCVVLYPLYESRVAMLTIAKGIIKDVFSGGGGKFKGEQKASAGDNGEEKARAGEA